MIALVDYGMGNLLSVSKALEAVGGTIEIIDDPSAIACADALILPGVGNFGDGMGHLRGRGLAPEIIKFVESGKPFLGICLGMQMLLEESEEAPGMKGLGIFKGKVKRFPESGFKVPHMGWNNISIRNEHYCLNNVNEGSYFYFVHSFYADPEDKSAIAASSSYILDFCAAIGKDNVFATQFHPEKSQNPGLQILRNFVGNFSKNGD
ncbi:MAG: imidazole glycerol phosphate synthase, glutamine amidotransferase subunit [Lentisphaerae bacterium GWF2_45_14]|nr:MAG: imidazole glycerol phosphate synthase, glutamine amidotransferase subunit [Lentisphaerae bacterium GWF2_45_14]